MLETPVQNLPHDERMLLVSEWSWVMELADTKGMTVHQLLGGMGSREYTMERARAIVSAAAREIAEKLAEAKARRQRGRRRR